MNRILLSLLVVTLQFGSVLADAPSRRYAKVTLVYQHELRTFPARAWACSGEYGPGLRLVPRMPEIRLIYATVLEGAIRSQVNDGPVTVSRPDELLRRCPAIATPSAPMPANAEDRKLLGGLPVVDTNETELTIRFARTEVVGHSVGS